MIKITNKNKQQWKRHNSSSSKWHASEQSFTTLRLTAHQIGRMMPCGLAYNLA